MNWKKFTLEELSIKVTSGGTPLRSRTEFYEGGTIPWIKTKEVKFNRIYNSDERITEKGLENSSAKLVPENSILIAMYGDGKTAGRCAINRIPVTTNQACCNLVINQAKANPDFIFYKLSTLYETFRGLKVGGSQQNLNAKTLREFEVEIPPLSIQSKIAFILSTYDDLIENNLKRIKLLEEKANLHYKELMQELSYTKTKREEYIKDCLSFYIGGGWGEEDYKEKFTEPAYVIRGTDIPDTRCGNISGIPLRFHKASNLESRKMQIGDIIFEISNGQINNIGRTVLISNRLIGRFDKPVMCASFAKLIRVNKKVTPEFFYLYLNEAQENGLLYQYKSNSANGINNFAFETFIDEVKITLPKEAELILFTEKLTPIFNLISTLGEQNSKLRETRDILLPRLINGQIEV